MKTKREELLETSATLLSAEIIGYKQKYTGYCDYGELIKTSITVAQSLLEQIDLVEPKPKKRRISLGK